MAIEALTMSPGSDIIGFIKEIEVLQAEALFFYNQTEFPKLLRKYALAVDGELLEGQSVLEERQGPRGIYWPRKKDSISAAVFWEETRLTTNGLEQWESSVGLEAHPNGAISIYGGIVFDRHSSPGSSYLTIDEWRNNRPVQEQALKKAFQIPFVTHYTRGFIEGSAYLH